MGSTRAETAGQKDVAKRNEVEGTFARSKRHSGIGLIQERPHETMIDLQFLGMNLDYKLRLFFVQFTNFLRLELPS